MPALIKNKRPSFEEAFEQVKALCVRQNARLTPLRAAVWECLWRSAAPMGAYDIVAVLKKSGADTPPVSVYRILAFFEEKGVVHHLAEENAYILCAFPEEKHVPVIAVCSVCGRLEELKAEKLGKDLKKNVKKFKIKSAIVRLNGVCAECRR